jgi:hypothetical protein
MDRLKHTYSAACHVRFFRSSWTRAGRERMLDYRFPTLPVALAFRMKHGAVSRVYSVAKVFFGDRTAWTDRRGATVHLPVYPPPSLVPTPASAFSVVSSVCACRATTRRICFSFAFLFRNLSVCLFTESIVNTIASCVKRVFQTGLLFRDFCDALLRLVYCSLRVALLAHKIHTVICKVYTLMHAYINVYSEHYGSV